MPTPDVLQRLARAPLWAVIAFTFVSSLGTGIVTTGIYFIAENAYGFSKTQNFALALANGLTYIAGAMGAGPALRFLRSRGISSRATLCIVMLLLAALCSIPLIARSAGSASHAIIWILVGLYSPLTGVLWPVVESYLSGGRRGPELRSALGRFNLTWSSALVLGLILIGPTVKHHAQQLIAALGAIHVASLLLLVPFGKEPGTHEHDEHESHPPVYTQLLTSFRILLPASYLVFTALNPYLPKLMGRLGFESGLRAPLAATWTAARVVTFFAFERWHGWQGRWYPAAIGVLVLIGGFALAVLSPTLGPTTLGRVAVLVGLALFGTGMAIIYTGALYYALEVGKAEVDAGGKHEALIGLGYTTGPLCALLAIGAARADVIPDSDSAFDIAVLLIVSVLAAIAIGYAARRSWRMARGNTPLLTASDT